MNDANSSLSSVSNPQVSHDEISRQAQELWETYGRPAGRDEEIWLEAERKLLAQQQASASGANPAPASEKLNEPAAPTPAMPPPARTSSRAGAATATPRMPGGRPRKG